MRAGLCCVVVAVWVVASLGSRACTCSLVRWPRLAQCSQHALARQLAWPRARVQSSHLPRSADASTWYVSTLGDDGNTGTSPELAFATIQVCIPHFRTRWLHRIIQ